MGIMDNQDWSSITIRNPLSRTDTKQQSIRVPEAAHSMKKIEQAEIGKFKVLSIKSRSELAQARSAKGMTQKQLDQKCQFPPNTCNSWEAGKACPTGPQINILHRILGIKLERD
jgi:ribosome-binding protein aMBF1 (putative translation factor)